jgi:hypothetical protein
MDTSYAYHSSFATDNSYAPLLSYAKDLMNPYVFGLTYDLYDFLSYDTYTNSFSDFTTVLHHEDKLEMCYNANDNDFCFYITAQSNDYQVHDELYDLCPNNYVMEPMDNMTEDAFTAYKRVDRKVKPVPGIFPENAHVKRTIPEDPLLTLPTLSTHPPEFVPTAKITHERLHLLGVNHDGFLWPEEEKLFAHIMVLNERALAFEDMERGTLR